MVQTSGLSPWRAGVTMALLRPRSPPTDCDRRTTLLSDDDLKAFFDTGWILRRGLFSAAEVRDMQAAFNRLEAIAAGLSETGPADGAHFVIGNKEGEQVIKRVVWAGAAAPYLLDIGADPRLTVPAASLLGSAQMEQLLCQAHFKRPNDGVIFGWHQDIQHRDKGGDTWRDVNGKGSYVQTLIALDEMTAESGPLKFMPGSGRWGKVDFGDHDYDDPQSPRNIPPEFQEDDAVTLLMQPGDTAFFGPYTAHASFENRSSTYRRVLINGYAYPGANRRVYPGEGSCRPLNVEQLESPRVPADE